MAHPKRTSRQVVSEKRKPKATRNAGILLHITSLPSNFGIGNLGIGARKFVDFLARSQQYYWQLLPLNPVTAEQGYSPYSSICGMAGNAMLISPEELASDGLVRIENIPPIKPDKVNFSIVRRLVEKILSTAYQNFLARGKQKDQFHTFCEREAYWLDDFANYVMIKKYHNNNPWYNWPREYKVKREKTIQQFSKSNEGHIRYIKWLQFIFFTQWRKLKSYANERGVQMFGDLPFYVSYDSADVWAHDEIFNIDKKGKMTGIAGVPPDYFNKNGQLWGMPTFDWKKLQERKYDWWVQRLRKNMELFDLLRLDHFRAFADFWEVPANQKTAINGEWKPGPGKNFFSSLQREFGHLPFIAEDLGDINEAVYQLRDRFNFPGMKVLQFAFGDSMSSSAYIPHHYTSNFFVYTGTHDNNTTRGWFEKNIPKQTRLQIADYIGKPVNEKNISVELARLAYSSVAKTVIVPMQDILGLDASARMNTPASIKNNWLWRMSPEKLNKGVEDRLAEWTNLYDR